MLELTEKNMCDHELVTKARKSNKKAAYRPRRLANMCAQFFQLVIGEAGHVLVERFAVLDSVCRVQFKSFVEEDFLSGTRAALGCPASDSATSHTHVSIPTARLRSALANHCAVH